MVDDRSVGLSALVTASEKSEIQHEPGEGGGELKEGDGSKEHRTKAFNNAKPTTVNHNCPREQQGEREPREGVGLIFAHTTTSSQLFQQNT